MDESYLETITLDELHLFISRMKKTSFSDLVSARQRCQEYRKAPVSKKPMSQDDYNSLRKLEVPNLIEREIYNAIYK